MIEAGPPEGRGFRRPWRAFLGTVATVKVPPEMAERIHRDRSIVLANMLRVISVAGLNVMLFWGIYFWEAPDRFILDALLCAAVIDYIALFFVSHRWVNEKADTGDPAAYVWKMFALLNIQGILTGLLIIAMQHVANPQQTGLIYAMLVADMSTPVLVAPLSIAFGYWIPVTLGGLISLFLGSQPFDPYALLCLASYALITGYAAIYLNNRLTERAISAIRVEENAELIKLLLRDFEESASDWLWETDAALRLCHVSNRLAEVAGKPLWILQGRFPEALLGDDFTPDGQCPAFAKLMRCLDERSPFRDLVVPVVVNGEERIWQLTGKPILDRYGAFAGYTGVGSDITAARRSQEQIAFLAHHDSLTKLANRVLFNEMLHLGCSRCEETGLALLCLDLDDFKSVNDTLGHATGDALLVAVAERIRGCIREGDVAARLGGDEFAVLLNTRDVEEVTMIARRLIERISLPYYLEGSMVGLGVSIGVSMAPRDGDAPNVVLKNADLALYRAKAAGRGTWRFYDVRMDGRVKDQRSLQTDLRLALARGELYLDFQPIIDLKNERIVSAEALIRWRHPERGELRPAEFILMAEGAGLIAPIGAWVLRQACAVAATWVDGIRVSINLSPLQFREEGLLAEVFGALKESGLAPSRLELEITETALLEMNPQTTEVLMALHQHGIGIALDDFGTGYSSLSYLRRFPFDKIKIDSSFIRDLGQKKDSDLITTAIIGLAKNLDLGVTAEGVETEEQAEFLIRHGCHQAQGYLFHRPLSAQAINDLIGKRPATPAASATDLEAARVISSAAE